MPYVNIKITNEGVTPEKKVQLIQGVTQLLLDVLGKDPKFIRSLKDKNCAPSSAKTTSIMMSSSLVSSILKRQSREERTLGASRINRSNK